MPEPHEPAPSREGAVPPLERTLDLLERIRDGDPRARERLFARFLPLLTAWAHERLPRGARDLAETDDLVQVTLARALRRLDRFEHRGEGAFLAYLRQILLNATRDEVRRAVQRRPHETIDEQHPDPSPSPLERVVGRDTLERYEHALQHLDTAQREAVILKVEMGYSNAELAEALGRPSVDAARVFVARALVALAEAMREPV